MRYTIAVAAASLATGAFAAGHGHAAHHQHHAREAEAAAEAEPTNYSWSDGQCFGTWGCLSKTGAPAAAQTSVEAATSVVAQAAAQQTTQAASSSSNAQPANIVQNVASKATSVAGSVASAVSGGSSSGGSMSVSNILNSVVSGNDKNAVTSILAAVSDGSCSEGTDHPNVMDISNNSGEDLVWVCWGSAGSWVSAPSGKAPIMALGIPNGQTKTISFANTASGAQGGGCAPVAHGTSVFNSQIQNTWLESTFNQYGTVDVSREVAANGHAITAKTASGCTTSMTQCVFKCKDSSATSCGDAGSYQLENCSGPGANSGNGGVDGGCMFGSGKMSVSIGAQSS